ncbi:protein NTM1-like 9 [Lathyrus oleraceus]|uniref:protein NTM1-like 9 n=1 Tax=Pisum sativum TaxID=3888 RepID=UPI0021D36CA8|nr:protein NTM1-like 9 [Pisum sativum]
MQSQLSNDVTTNNEIEDINLITLPPGYRFNPNDIELIDYYLKQKLQGVHIVPPRIHDVDVYKFSPQQLENSYKFKGEDTMYFFTPRSKKYENGQRPDRAVENHGFWKATGKENSVMNNDVEIGFKRSLVFYTENSYNSRRDTMYFFTPRSKKYENGQRPDRAVENHGFWKATGKENSVMNNDVEIGFKRSLVFYTGKQGKAKELVNLKTIGLCKSSESKILQFLVQLFIIIRCTSMPQDQHFETAMEEDYSDPWKFINFDNIEIS